MRPMRKVESAPCMELATPERASEQLLTAPPDLGRSGASLLPQSPGRCSSRPSSAPQSMVSVHEVWRTKKAVDSNVKAIQNRIRYFQREEEKMWRDLEEVRRQAATVECGRSRHLEKKIIDRTIQKEREILLQSNRARAAATKSAGSSQRKLSQFTQMRERQLAGQHQRQVSQDILRQKRQQEEQVRLQNAERAAAIQRAQLEGKLKVNQERTARIERLREEHEAMRQAAEDQVQAAEQLLPQLEADEIARLQRLQNSRIVTQSVLEELESSLGAQNAAVLLLRSKQQRGQDWQLKNE